MYLDKYYRILVSISVDLSVIGHNKKIITF